MNTEYISKLKNDLPDAIRSETHFLGETTLETDKSALLKLLSSLKENGYRVLMDLTGTDYLQPEVKTKVLYWLHNPKTYERVRIIVYVPRQGSLPSVTSLWEGANWYERELYDMFGIHFENHPDLKRLLMPDDWQGHPMLKDYPLTEEPVAFKNDVKPKVPSKIIHVERSQKNY